MSRVTDYVHHTPLRLLPAGPNMSLPGCIGPNAVTRMAEALIALDNKTAALAVFQDAGIERYLEAPPVAPVPETEVTALMHAAHARLGTKRADTTAWIAGHRTAEYLLENRIPPLAQRLLRALPAPLASRLLCRIMAGHAWTFAGSGQVHFEHGSTTRIVIAGCPLCGDVHAEQPACTYYAATFEKLYTALVQSHARVVETECQGMGHAACIFNVTWN